jgi:hypothetical protein
MSLSPLCASVTDPESSRRRLFSHNDLEDDAQQRDYTSKEVKSRYLKFARKLVGWTSPLGGMRKWYFRYVSSVGSRDMAALVFTRL